MLAGEETPMNLVDAEFPVVESGSVLLRQDSQPLRPEMGDVLRFSPAAEWPHMGCIYANTTTHSTGN